MRFSLNYETHDDKCYLTKSQFFSFGLTRNDRMKEGRGVEREKRWEEGRVGGWGREAGREEGRKLDIIPREQSIKTDIKYN